MTAKNKLHLFWSGIPSFRYSKYRKCSGINVTLLQLKFFPKNYSYLTQFDDRRHGIWKKWWNIYGRWCTFHVKTNNFFECLKIALSTVMSHCMSHCYSCLYIPRTCLFSLYQTQIYNCLAMPLLNGAQVIPTSTCV